MRRRKTLLKIVCHYLCEACALTSSFSWLKEYDISNKKASTLHPGQTDVRITI